jgi:hypothetical protein
MTVRPDLATILRRWPEVVSRASAHPPTRPVIVEAWARHIVGNCLVLGVPGNKPWLVEAANRRSSVIAAALADIFGLDWTVRAEGGSRPDQGHRPPASPFHRPTVGPVPQPPASPVHPPPISQPRVALTSRRAAPPRRKVSPRAKRPPIVSESRDAERQARDAENQRRLEVARRVERAHQIAQEMQKARKDAARRAKGPSPNQFRAHQESAAAYRYQQARSIEFARKWTAEMNKPVGGGSLPGPADDWREQG